MYNHVVENKETIEKTLATWSHLGIYLIISYIVYHLPFGYPIWTNMVSIAILIYIGLQLQNISK